MSVINPIRKGIFFAILAAVLYAINAPFSKVVLEHMPPILMAGFLYIGSALAMLMVGGMRLLHGRIGLEKSLEEKEWPYIIAMILLDVISPACLMMGLKLTTAENASLLSNFEVVVTAVLALFFFGEKISRRLWVGIFFVTVSCCVLSFEDMDSLHFSNGSLLVVLSAFFWGLDNNITKMISDKDPLQIVLLKGLFSGTIALLVGFYMGEAIESVVPVLAALAIGLVSYGMSVYVDIYAQRYLGAARTSAYYAISPFIGTGLSLLIFQQTPPSVYWIGLVLMGVGTWLCSRDTPLININPNRTLEKKEKE
ncbi:MAG: DMT family transporter [Paludibacteraceae bacterium]|nr:DMT family transporter [Paludibacteraceae bacterium]